MADVGYKIVVFFCRFLKGNVNQSRQLIALKNDHLIRSSFGPELVLIPYLSGIGNLRRCKIVSVSHLTFTGQNLWIIRIRQVWSILNYIDILNKSFVVHYILRLVIHFSVTGRLFDNKFLFLHNKKWFLIPSSSCLLLFLVSTFLGEPRPVKTQMVPVRKRASRVGLFF